MKGLDLSKFKKVHEDGGRAVLRHPLGHEIAIAKRGLSPKMKEQLSSLELHKAEGGAVEDPNAQPQQSSQMPTINIYNSPQPNANQTAMDQPMPAQAGAMPVPAPTPTAPPQFAPAASAPPPTATPLASMQPQQTPAPSPPVSAQSAQPATASPEMAGNQAHESALKGGLQQQEAGAFNEAKALGEQGVVKEQAAIEKQKQGQQLIDNFHQEFNSLQTEVKNILGDMKAGQIDPNHYINNMSTGSKVSTAIGLLIGGLTGGGGASASKWLDDQIGRDIDAQKANMDKKNNIMTALFKMQGSLQGATEVYRALSLENYAAKADEIAGKFANPLARAKAQMFAGEKRQQAAEALSNVAMKSAMFKSMGANGMGDGNIDPATLVTSRVPKDHQKEVFKEIKDAQNASRVQEEFMKHWDDAVKENTVLKTGAGLLRRPPSIKAMDQLALPLIHDAEGRVNEFEQKTVQENYPQPGDRADTQAVKRKAMLEFFAQKSAAPTAKGNNIDLTKYASTGDARARLTPQQKTWVEWADKNPGRPEAKQLKQKLGIK